MSKPKMCKGHDCPLKRDCYRFTREPDKNQEYYKDIPYDENGRTCDFYLPEWVIQELKYKTNGITDNHSNGQEGWKAN